MSFEQFLSRLETLLPVRRGEPMADHTTFRIGGPAEAYVHPHDCLELHGVVVLAQEWEVPLFLLGAGSNLLVGDNGIPGLVVETWYNRDLPAEKLEAQARHGAASVRVNAFCGVPLPRIAYQTARAGLAGLEWAVGIPGTIGGGVVNNAGAHGSCMADVVQSVLVWSPQGERILMSHELGFGYRDSNFRTRNQDASPHQVIVSVELLLKPDAPEAIESRIAEHVAHRRATQPIQRSVGSIFKNPEGYAAGWLIEQAGLKGRRIGDAQISTKHANFIVNRGHANAAVVNELMLIAQTKIREDFGIQLEPEIQKVGEGF